MEQPPPGQFVYVRDKPPQPLWQRIGKWVLAAVAGAVIAGAAGAVSPRVAWGWPPGWTDPADKELRGYAYTLEMMLIVSQPHRGDLTALSEAINNCRILPSVALARAETIMSDRQAALKGLQRNEAPDPGVELQQLVFGAYTASLRTDNDLIEWLKAVDAADPAGQPCYHRDDLLYKQFVTESSDATAAKKQFVAAFNPVARKFGFAPPSWQWWEF